MACIVSSPVVSGSHRKVVQGRTYLCKKLDLDSKVATVRPADLKYYTKVRDMCDIHVVGGRLAFPSRVSLFLMDSQV